MSKNIIFLFLLFCIMEISTQQEIDKDMMRAVACISMIRKLENKPSDQRLLSSYILTCFIAIDEPTTQKLLMSQTSNKLDLTQDEIEKLTNMYNLEQKYTEDQIMDFSKALNTALEKLKDAQPGGGMRNPSQGHDSGSNNKKKPQGVGLLEKMFAGILGLFSTNDSLLLLFGFFIAFYLFLRQIRKWFGGNSTSDKNGSKKTVKIKKKVKKNE